MRFKASCLRTLVLMLSVLVATAAFAKPVPSVQAQMVQQHKCVADLGIKPEDAELAATKRITIAVHGYRGNANHWKGTASIERTLKGIDDVVPVYFDYEKANTRWVTDPEIAPRLAQYIVCYSILSKRPVILLTHSMGGLAAREALDSAAYGILAKNVVKHVTAIAPPHKGARYADVESHFWLAACRGPFLAPFLDAPCRRINSARATGGMQIGSEQLAKLAHFPPGISVKTIAGEVSWQACLPWGCTKPKTTGGDLVVSVESATAEYTNLGRGDGKTIFKCTSDQLIAPLSTAWCEHSNLLRAPQVQAEVKRSIQQYLRQEKLEEEGVQYIGEWYVHGSIVTFNEDGTGQESINWGPCGPNGEDCRAIAELSWEPTEEGLTYTVKSLQAVALTEQGNIPVDADVSELDQPGTTRSVVYEKPGLLMRARYELGNAYLCRHWLLSPDDMSKCGA